MFGSRRNCRKFWKKDLKSRVGRMFLRLDSDNNLKKYTMMTRTRMRTNMMMILMGSRRLKGFIMISPSPSENMYLRITSFKRSSKSSYKINRTAFEKLENRYKWLFRVVYSTFIYRSDFWIYLNFWKIWVCLSLKSYSMY